MKLVVCGAGQVGYQIARQLSDEGNAVTVIDVNGALVRQVTDALDVSGVVGFASHPDVLSRAGAADCDMLIAATSMDEVNMVACQVAHSVFEVPVKIARVRTDSYLGAEWSDLFRRDHMPIDVIISPEAEVAKVTMRRLGATAAFDIEPFLEGKVMFVGMHVAEDCPTVNTPLRQLSELFSTLRCIVVAIRRGGRIFVPQPDDQIFAAATRSISPRSSRTCSGPSAFSGARTWWPSGSSSSGPGNIGLQGRARWPRPCPICSAKMIEMNRARAEFAADQLESTIVLNGDALDRDVLEEAGIGEADAHGRADR